MTPPDDNAAREYAALADEVIGQRRSRLRTFAVATMLVLVLVAATFLLGPVDPETQAARLVLIYLAHGVVLVALLLTHRRTHRMQFTTGYLEAIVEPRVAAGGPAPKRRRFQSLETSRALGACYALLISVIVAAGIANGLYRSMWAVGLPLLALVGVLNANLLFMNEVRDLRRLTPRQSPSGG